jgi:hypothetical protein
MEVSLGTSLVSMLTFRGVSNFPSWSKKLTPQGAKMDIISSWTCGIDENQGGDRAIWQGEGRICKKNLSFFKMK